MAIRVDAGEMAKEARSGSKQMAKRTGSGT